MISAARQEKIRGTHVSSWLKASIIEASHGYPGTRDYAGVGYAVGRHLDDLIQGLGDDKYREAIKEWETLDINDTHVLKNWCRKWIRHVMQLIPYARQVRFVHGIRKACTEREVFFKGGN